MMTYTMTDRIQVVDPMRFVRKGDTFPNIYPMPSAYKGAPTRTWPHVVWRKYWHLHKEPLLVRCVFSTDTALEAGAHHLDGILSAAQLRAAEAAWTYAGEAGVIPLPLDLLGVVSVDETPRRKLTWPKLPVWASTPLVQESPRHADALCIGHADTVRELLSYIHEVDEISCAWEVTPLPLSMNEAREVITEQRPMPGVAKRWTPPYWYDWENRQTKH